MKDALNTYTFLSTDQIMYIHFVNFTHYLDTFLRKLFQKVLKKNWIFHQY